MGAPKQKWTEDEEEALRAGVEKHGAGKWRTIQKDPEFSRFLSTRSNIDLKDKWRNMNVSAGGQGSREKARMPKPKGLPAPDSSSQGHMSAPALPAPAPAPVQKKDGPSGVTDDAKNLQDPKDPPRYAAMIIEAITTMQEQSGPDISAICNFIEQKHEVPQNFRRSLSPKLRRLVLQNKIEKVQNGYKIKESFATKTPTSKQTDPAGRVKAPQNSGSAKHIDPMEKEAILAAYKIADAEAKSFLASEAVKEADKIAKMAEESDSLLMLAKEIYDRCARGEIVTIS